MPDPALEVQGFFPQRGRQWRAWEDEFLKTFAAEFGLAVSAETLRRSPQDVALRISWLGVKMPAEKVSCRCLPQTPPKLEKVPSAWPRAKAEAPEGWLTCAEVAKMAECRINQVYSAIWKKKLDALQGDRGVWLIPEDAGREFAEARKPQTPKEAPERPVEAKEGAGMENLPPKAEDAPETPPEAQKCHAPEIIPTEPLPNEKPAEARATSPVKGPSPQAPDLSSMSKLDILRALAEGRTVGGCSV